MTIDNFDIIRQHLTFEKARKFDSKSKQLKEINDTYDRYIVHIIKRAKDSRGKQYGANEGNRLIKTYEISSLEYFDKKKPHMIDLCESNNARAYILPQVRSTYDCLKAMLPLIVDNLENPTIKFQHILRSALCSMHKSRAPRWVIDLDTKEMYGYTFGQVEDLVKDNLKNDCRKDDFEFYHVETPNGYHIITEPFNTKTANDKCFMMFEGVKKGVTPDELDCLNMSYPDVYATIENEYRIGIINPFTVVNRVRELLKKDKVDWNPVLQDVQRKVHDITGWLHKDGMTLLHATKTYLT